jgi:Helix-turn-helix domain
MRANHNEGRMNRQQLTENGLLNETELAERVFGRKVSVRTLQTWRRQGRGPKFLKIGRKVFYDPKDIAAYFDQSRVETELPTAEIAQLIR